jgi:hypothetical protein
LEEGVLERVAPAVFGIPKRREFPGEQTVWFLLWGYSKYTEHRRKPFFCSGGILFTQSTKWVLISCCLVMSSAFSYNHGQGCQLKLIKITLKIILFTQISKIKAYLVDKMHLKRYSRKALKFGH